MSAATQAIALALYRGKHQEVLARTLDAPDGKVSGDQVPFVIGALSFLGRIEEAESYFRLRRNEIDERGLFASRFFLGIGFTRHSAYATGRHHLGTNLRAASRSRDPVSRFYAFQGVGFYRQLSGRLRDSLRWANRAYDEALAASFPYGKTFAAELRGHVLVKTGQVSLGLEVLEHATKLAEALEATGLVAMLTVAKACYRAERGLEPATILSSLETIRGSLAAQNSFSRSTLLLEIGRQLTLRGRVREAKEILNEALRLVCATRNRRHEISLSVLYSHVLYLSGDQHAALNLIRSAKRLLDAHFDFALEIRVLGMEMKCLDALGIDEGREALAERITRLTKLVGDALGVQMRRRQRGEATVPDRAGDDPLCDLLDLAARDHEAGLTGLLAAGYHGLLYHVVRDVTPGEATLYLDLVPGAIACFDRDGAHFVAGALSPTLRKVCRELARGETSKQALIERVWGYRYHPLRHDPLIYSTVAKLRRSLGERSHWIEATESGYRIARARVIFHSAPATAGTPRAPARPPETRLPRERALNLRQLKILQYARKHDAIALSTCRKLFPASRVTCSRDLATLVREGWLERVGRARATQYVPTGHPLLDASQ